MSVKISYNHRSAEIVDSVDTALDHVRTAMIHSACSASAADEMVEIETDDGVYCYYDQDAADRDQTGARAFALIEREGGRNSR